MGGVTAVGAAWIFYLDRHLTFFGDDWTLIVGARQNLMTLLLAPHSGHFLLVHGLLYDALFNLVGLHSYRPYVALLLGVHAATVLLLFVLVRRRSGDILAFGAAALLLVYGAAAEDLAWAFQVGFILPVAFGLAALVLLDKPNPRRRNLATASVLLVLGVATSAMGLVMLVAVGGELFLDRTRRRALVVLVPVAVVYGAWYGLIARHAPPSVSLSMSTLSILPARMAIGLEGAAAGIFGLPLSLGVFAAFALGLFLAATWWRRGYIGSRAAGPLIAVGAEFFLIGLARAEFGIQPAASSRYMYTAAVLLLLVLTDALARLPVRWEVWVPLGALTLISLWLNANQLATFVFFRTLQTGPQTAELQTFEAYRGDPAIDSTTLLDPIITPVTPSQYYDLSAAWGRPVLPVSVSDLVTLEPSAVDRALVTLFANGLLPSQVGSQSECAASDQLEVAPGSMIRVIPNPGAVAVLSVAVMDMDQTPPSVSVSAPTMFSLNGDRLPGPWRVHVSGGSVCAVT
jgi:hypothetical protein